uniref:Calpain 8 n=1 Tax=Monodelphis domestica TaxID=13616 RepID=A0A5F8G8N2_MONDO
MAAMAGRLSKQQLFVSEGLGSSQNAVKYLDQDFETLRKQCLESGTLFKDPEFPACPSALGYKDLGPYSPQTQGIIWKRPTELCPDPQFIIGGATRTDVRQGALGDCWLLAAIASLTLNEELLYRVVPKDQSFQKNYAGIFHFQFWQYGEWVDVVIDDRLPTRNGNLLFLHSEEGREFWSALMEKAYAKLNGSYEALTGGSTVEGFEDFTGGISEFYDLKKPPSNLYQIIRKALRSGSLLGCSIDITNASESQEITSLKLVKGHAYSVTGVEEVNYRGCLEKLIRLRNPWGGTEWTGAWSDSAPEWNYIDPRQKKELDKKAEDGEFWMSFSDFLRQFSRLEICNLSPDSLTSEEIHKWNMTLFNGRWIRGSTAGGCQNYPATYWTNPQFKIRLDEADDHHEGNPSEPCCTVLLGLMQKNSRRKKRMGQGMLSIGYSLYQLENHTEVHLSQDFFLGHQPAAKTPAYINRREVSTRIHLPVGEYLVVPSTFEPFKDGEFFLRIFSEKEAKSLHMGLLFLPEIPKNSGLMHFMAFCQGHHFLCLQVPLKLSFFLFKHLGTDVKSDGFNINTCREMIGLLDVSFQSHFFLICRRIIFLLGISFLFQEIYQEVDINHSGTINAHEMRMAFKKAGFTLNNQVQQAIAVRYGGSSLNIHFDSFIACMMRLESLFKIFSLLDKDHSGTVHLSLAEVNGIRLAGLHLPTVL